MTHRRETWPTETHAGRERAGPAVATDCPFWRLSQRWNKKSYQLWQPESNHWVRDHGHSFFACSAQTLCLRSHIRAFRNQAVKGARASRESVTMRSGPGPRSRRDYCWLTSFTRRRAARGLQLPLGRRRLLSRQPASDPAPRQRPEFRARCGTGTFRNKLGHSVRSLGCRLVRHFGHEPLASPRRSGGGFSENP